MLYREIIAVCSQIHTKHINTLCGQNVELLNVKLSVHIVTTGLWSVTWLVVTTQTVCILMKDVKVNSPYYYTNAYGEVLEYLHALYGDELSASRSDRFTPEQRAPGETY